MPSCLALAAALLCCCWAHKIDAVKQQPAFITENASQQLEQFDYIVVGGGTAGCALAATLSQSFKVLVLERGGWPYDDPNIMEADNVLVNLANPDVAESFTSEEGVPNLRGRVLGGGSCINRGIYSRADPDFIREAKLDEKLAESSYKWVEDVVAGFPTHLEAFHAAVGRALLESGITPDRGATFDHLIGTKIGGSIFHQNTRRPASDLLLEYANPENILVLLHATAHKLLFKGASNIVCGVEFSDSQGHFYSAFLHPRPESEIILSAGALGSPQLLMLSGIGPKDHLESMGVKVFVNSPRVGKSMADNPALRIFLASPVPLAGLSSQFAGISPDFIILGSALTETQGGIVGKVMGPESKGELKLKSLNVSDVPLVRFNYFQIQADLQRCVAAVNVLEEMVLSEALAPYRFSNQSLPSGGTVSSPSRRNATLVETGYINSTIAQFCKRMVSTIYHEHGGCTQGEVVDDSYRVTGVSGLRVVDASTFKTSPGTNPQATIMMLGRYVGAKILESRRKAGQILAKAAITRFGVESD